MRLFPDKKPSSFDTSEFISKKDFSCLTHPTVPPVIPAVDRMVLPFLHALSLTCSSCNKRLMLTRSIPREVEITTSSVTGLPDFSADYWKVCCNTLYIQYTNFAFASGGELARSVIRAIPLSSLAPAIDLGEGYSKVVETVRNLTRT